MRIPITSLQPVAIALDQIQTGGDVRFTGIDLDSGARVSVLIERTESDGGGETPELKEPAHGLVLVLTMEMLDHHLA